MIETSISGRCRVQRHSCPYHEERRYSVKESLLAHRVSIRSFRLVSLVLSSATNTDFS